MVEVLASVHVGHPASRVPAQRETLVVGRVTEGGEGEKRLGREDSSHGLESSRLDGPGNTRVGPSRPRNASRGYERSCTRLHGWPRLAYLLCQRGRPLPSCERSWGLLRAHHATLYCGTSTDLS